MASDLNSVLAKKDGETDESLRQKAWLFHYMASCPAPFLLIIPIVFAFLIGFGWSQDDIIETKVRNIWIPESGDFAQNIEYAKSWGRGENEMSSFAAMAVSRDGGNLFTADRLEEIRARMEEIETVQVEYQGRTYTWEDVCQHSLHPYEFPCPRLSPMDLFQESRWSFDDDNEIDRRMWYSDIQKGLTRPIVPRLGTMIEQCGLMGTGACNQVLLYRLSPWSDGYNPAALFADIVKLVRYWFAQKISA
jgi:hypothetical protein